jgi:hypothetical protein
MKKTFDECVKCKWAEFMAKGNSEELKFIQNLVCQSWELLKLAFNSKIDLEKGNILSFSY